MEPEIQSANEKLTLKKRVKKKDGKNFQTKMKNLSYFCVDQQSQ
jgi:hypothetical protein